MRPVAVAVKPVMTSPEADVIMSAALISDEQPASNATKLKHAIPLDFFIDLFIPTI
jgi:hypothetical protein